MLLISVPRSTIPASKVSSTAVLVGRSSVLGDGLAHGRLLSLGQGWECRTGAVRPAPDARTPARFRTGVRIATDHSSGSSLERRSPPRWCSNYNCRSLHITSFRSYRPYPMRRACASGWFVRRRGRTSSLDALRGGSDDLGSVGLVAQHLEAGVEHRIVAGLGGRVGDRRRRARCPCRGSTSCPASATWRSSAGSRRCRPRAASTAGPCPCRRSWCRPASPVRDRGARPATISDADADPPSTRSDELDRRVGGGPAGPGRRLGQVAVGVLLPEDRAVGEELAGDVAGRGDEPAGVAAQVDDQLALAAPHAPP